MNAISRPVPLATLVAIRLARYGRRSPDLLGVLCVAITVEVIANAIVRVVL